jgi:hypothetical protein
LYAIHAIGTDVVRSNVIRAYQVVINASGKSFNARDTRNLSNGLTPLEIRKPLSFLKARNESQKPDESPRVPALPALLPEKCLYERISLLCPRKLMMNHPL